MIKMSDITEETQYKCHTCKKFLKPSRLLRRSGSLNPYCPKCHGAVEQACPNDKPCNHTMVAGVKKCDICGAYVCPICGGHNVSPISRITGYMSPIGSWGAGKRQEFEDRQRTDV